MELEHLTRREKAFLPYLEQIKKLGYRCFISTDRMYRTYCIIADDQGRIGYCQVGDYEHGCRFSTKHKYCKGFGGGFAIQDWQHPVDVVERAHVEEALSVAPAWAYNEFGAERISNEIKKWTLDEWLKSGWSKHMVEYETED